MAEWGNGYGFSPEDVEAAWQELEANGPRGPGCPFTAELLDLALGLSSPERGETLREHMGACPRCDQRFRFQRGALGEAARVRVAAGTPRSPVAEAFRDRAPYLLSGEVSLLKAQAADDGGPAWIEQIARLGIAGAEGGHTVQVILSWSKEAGSPPEGKRTRPVWKLALRVPSPEADPEHGNERNDLEVLDGCEVMLVLRTSEDKRLPLHGTRLEWSPTRREVVSHPEEVPDMSDPHTVTRIDLYREKTLDAYDT